MAGRTKQLEAARAAKAKARRFFSRFGEVSGVGITRKGNDYAVKVNMKSAPRGQSKWPDEIDGVPVMVDIVGTIRKQKN